MRSSVVGAVLLTACIGFGVLTSRWTGGGPVRAATPARAAGGSLITMIAQVGDHQQLTVVDQETRAVAVYNIDAGGNIELKCVRNVHQDLQLDAFNGKTPFPGEIKSQVRRP